MNKLAISALIVLATGVLVVQHVDAQSSTNSSMASPSMAADNTGNNKVDRSNATATADAQTNNATDIDLTMRIRKSVMADKSLSTYAHNVKIVTVNGSVTLNGVVRSEEEKGAIEMKATAVAGKNNVINDLKITPSN